MEQAELNKLLDNVQLYYSSLDAKAYSRQLNQSGSRASLMYPSSSALKSSSHRLGSFGPHASFIINAGSSDEGSDEEVSFPSLKLVTEQILDSKYTAITDTHIHNRYHPAALIIFNLDRRSSIFQTKSTLLSIGSGVVKIVPVDFDFDSASGFIHCGIVYFSSIDEAHFMYNKLLKYEKRGKLGSILQRIPGAQVVMSVRWFTYQVLDPQIDWTAVILRGLHHHIGKKEIDEAFEGVILRSEPPREINFEICTIVIVKNCADAEKVIRTYPSFRLGGKADLHPFSSMCKNPEQAAEVLFSEYRKKKAKNLLQAGLKYFNVDQQNDSEDARSLISSLSGTVEDGEITDTDAPISETSQSFYILYEHPGSYINKDQEVSLHSGVYVKTIFNYQNNF